MACKAAVKANDYLTQLEMEKLISDLRYIDNPFNCPHGRPIIIKFTEYELYQKGTPLYLREKGAKTY